ncbi:SRSF protein kinase 3 isoform X2 [Pseudorasbora parva]|uniref:SRSF protein kinase 3 isoform X2 n=1 Tax=Pseudorasbora parva TaxID=51549 RepID=UPI00351EF42C
MIYFQVTVQRSCCKLPQLSRVLRSKCGAGLSDPWSHAAMDYKLKTLNYEHLEPDYTEEHEDPKDYCYGGYHPVTAGDVFNKRYKVLSKLGWGYFSTVWLCVDLRSGRHVAVKVLKSGAGFTQAGQDELTLLRCASGPTARNPLKRHIVQLLDEFKIAGVNGIHICLVLELLGPNLRCWQVCFGSPGLSLICVKHVITQVLEGLEYLHRHCKIIHTDIKPENILLCLTPQSPPHPTGGALQMHTSAIKTTILQDPAGKPGNLDNITVKIADLGSSCWVYKHFCQEIQTRQYRSLEVLLGTEYGPPADIWSVACLTIWLILLSSWVKSQCPLLCLGNIHLSFSTAKVTCSELLSSVHGGCMKCLWRNITSSSERHRFSLISFCTCWTSCQSGGPQQLSVSNIPG